MSYEENPPIKHCLHNPSLNSQIAEATGLFQDDATVRTLVESFAEAFLVIDEKAMVIMVNRRFVDLFGYDPEEIIGASLNKIIPQRFHTAHSEHVKKYFNTPHIRSMGRGLELKGQKKSGEEFPVEVSLSYLQTDSGRMGLAFITDVTERSAAEKALHKQNQALSNFAQTVAHDLKSLITAITGFSDLLEEQFDNMSATDRLNALGMVKEAGYKMSDIVSELLLLAQVKREEVVLEPVDIQAAAAEALKRLQWKLSTIDANVSVKESPVILLGYQPWLEEVLYNLISNALSHGGEKLSVEVTTESVEKGRWRVMVADNGYGMSAEQVRILMEQPDDLPYTWIKGHGLGLSIVHHILEKLGSSLEVFCEENIGCRFSFLLSEQTS